ncbi:MAG: cobalt-precorrin 5A hydrolase [ANME-2 cluster archaeon]|nr:cobalt-precorrin 5A hydrolase [ANME-2 cluster archaeon]
MRTGIVHLKHNRDAAEQIQECVGGALIPYSKDAFRTAFTQYEAIIAVMACGIVVRELAPFLDDKWTDPPVVVVDAGLNYAIALCGGHHGANELAQRLAGTGAHPVITTATESLGRPSVEGTAQALGCSIVNRDSTRSVNSHLLTSDLPVIEIHGPKVVVVDPDVSVLQKKRGERQKGVIVGIGARRNVSSDNVVDAIQIALSESGLGMADVELFASADVKEHEAGLIEAISIIGGHIVFVPGNIINSINPPSDSRAKRLGLTGVCEPAALALSREHTLIMKKKVFNNVTIAIAR